jgi:ribonuclease HI
MEPFIIYADGSTFNSNPGAGGWGVVMLQPRRELNGGPIPNTTNNRMELTAAIEALKLTLPGDEIIIRSDSLYVVNTIMKGWRRKANHDLWILIDRERAVRSVTFEWVKGHATDIMNHRADELAKMGSRGNLVNG